MRYHVLEIVYGGFDKSTRTFPMKGSSLHEVATRLSKEKGWKVDYMQKVSTGYVLSGEEYLYVVAKTPTDANAAYGEFLLSANGFGY